MDRQGSWTVLKGGRQDSWTLDRQNRSTVQAGGQAGHFDGYNRRQAGQLESFEKGTDRTVTTWGLAG